MNKKATIKLEFDKEEYLKLAQLVYLGEWIANSHREEPNNIFTDVIDKINEKSDEFEMGHLIYFDPQSKKHEVTAEFESYLDEYIQDYDNETFWDEIIYRLAERDLVKKYGTVKIDIMSPFERIEIEQPLLEKYQLEFNEFGLENLIIRKDIKLQGQK